VSRHGTSTHIPNYYQDNNEDDDSDDNPIWTQFYFWKDFCF
jgi:hypothetical protein